MDPIRLLAEVPRHASDEVLATLLNADDVRFERIVSHGHASPEGFWYDQDEAEFVVVLQGGARLTIEGRIVELGPGDALNIPAHARHRVDWTTPDEPTVWLAVFYGPSQKSG